MQEERVGTIDIQIQGTRLNISHIAVPVKAKERIEVIDIVRGFALLGIFIVNMFIFSGSSLAVDMWAGPLDTLTASFVKLFFAGKFYVMFVFLFGLGFAMFFERAKEKAKRPTLLFYRRLFILIIIGLVHAFFIWSGDVLISYALFGSLLPLFSNRKHKTIIIWAVSIFVVFMLCIAYDDLSRMMAGTYTDMQQLVDNRENIIEKSLRIYGQGTFTEIIALRISETLLKYKGIFYLFFITFPLLLLGLYVGKIAVFQKIEGNIALIKKTWKWGLVIGLVMSIMKPISKNLMISDPYFFYDLIRNGTEFLGNTGLSLFFLTSIVLLCRNSKWLMKLKPLAYMGRMPLSNYLFQSIVCTTIFYNYGLGLYGKVGPALGLVLTTVILTIQISISKYCLKRYQFGPLEWIWKSLTYPAMNHLLQKPLRN